MATLKIVITSRENLKTKYGTGFTKVDKLLSGLVTADKKRKLTTKIVYIDNAASAAQVGLKAVTDVSRKSVKQFVDNLFAKQSPAYLVIFGSQDVIPFQELKNPVDDSDDDDTVVPSDLPYACNTPYGTNVASFTGPARVVGRIPDIPGKADIDYLGVVFKAIGNYKPVTADKLQKYFAVSAKVWQKSTQQSIANIFGNNTNLKTCPASITGYPKKDLQPLVHFYNCHGSPTDSQFYGQQGKTNFPVAQYAPDIHGKLSAGTIVAAECCYGAEVFNPAIDDRNQLSIANTYFLNGAVAFVGSSTIAYGPADDQGLADLVTQYFVKNVLAGASSGRALLEARQLFLSTVGPDLDPYELKTLAQFYLLGDPSLQVVADAVPKSAGQSVLNRRINLQSKGSSLKNSMCPSEKVQSRSTPKASALPSGMKQVISETGFTGKETQSVYKVKAKKAKAQTEIKALLAGKDVVFRTFTQNGGAIRNDFNVKTVLVMKVAGDELLGWKVYHSK